MLDKIRPTQNRNLEPEPNYRKLLRYKSVLDKIRLTQNRNSDPEPSHRTLLVNSCKLLTQSNNYCVLPSQNSLWEQSVLSAKGYLSEKPRGDHFHVKDRIQVLSDLKPAPSPSSQDRPRRQLGRANCSGITLRDEKGQAQECVVGVG